MTPLELHNKAWDLISDPSRWTQIAPARDSKGNRCYPISTNACKWCSDGALLAISDMNRTPEYHEVCAALNEAVKILSLDDTFDFVGLPGPFWVFNDVYQHHEVMQMWERAEKILKGEQDANEAQVDK